jgi:hypothetical protein
MGRVGNRTSKAFTEGFPSRIHCTIHPTGSSSTMLSVGRDSKNQEIVYLNASHSRAVLICGKRGSGKSYTLVSLSKSSDSKQNNLVIIIDPMGIYYPWPNPIMARIDYCGIGVYTLKACPHCF